MRNRNIEIDILKGFAIFLMVVQHIRFDRFTNHYIVAFIMPLFFIVSGYLYNDSYKFGERIRRKFKTLMAPYFVWGFIFTAFWTLLYRDNSDEIINAWRVYLFYPTNKVKYGVALWFLPCMFVTDTLYTLIRRINPVWFNKLFPKNISLHKFPQFSGEYIQNSRAWMLHTLIIIFISVIGCLYSANKTLPMLPFAVEPAMTAILFMHFGYLIKQLTTENENKLLNLPVPFLIGLFFISGILAFVNSTIDMRTSRYWFPPLYFINGFLLTIFWWNVAKRVSILYKNKFPNNFFVYLSQNSMIYLCLNCAIIILLKNAYSNILNHLNYGDPAYYVDIFAKILMLAMTIIIVFICNEIIIKTKLKWIIGKK